MEGRRRDMKILEGIPAEILDKVEDPGKWDDIPSCMQTELEMNDEILDLYQEKQYLIATVEYLKDRLNKVQTR